MHFSFRRCLALAAIVAVCGCGENGDEFTTSSDLSSGIANRAGNGNGHGNGKGQGNGNDQGNRSAGCSQDHKVLICHIPPGNPANAHEICIDRHALAAHKRNHGDGEVDALGECPDTGAADAGQPDAGQPDAGQPDAGQPDAGDPGPGIN